jgi:hypothetical protein
MHANSGSDFILKSCGLRQACGFLIEKGGERLMGVGTFEWMGFFMVG